MTAQGMSVSLSVINLGSAAFAIAMAASDAAAGRLVPFSLYFLLAVAGAAVSWKLGLDAGWWR